MLTIASLTLREAVRRRIAVVAAIASIAIIALMMWGLHHLVSSIGNQLAGLAIASALTIFLAFVFSVVLALGAAFLAAPSIAGDIESGIALAIVPRPLSRVDYVLGKWLGLAALLVAYAAIFGTLGVAAIALATGYQPPNGPAALAFLIAQSLLMLSLALALSTRLAAVAGGLLAVLCFGVAWIAGIAGSIASAVHNEGLLHATTLVGLAFPSDGLWRGALYHLEPVTLLAATNARGVGAVNPFGTSSPAPTPFVLWSIAWIVLAVGVAAFSFNRRDL